MKESKEWTTKELLNNHVDAIKGADSDNEIKSIMKSVFQLYDENPNDSIWDVKTDCRICGEKIKISLMKQLVCDKCKDEARREIKEYKLDIKLDEHLHNKILSNKLASDE